MVAVGAKPNPSFFFEWARKHGLWTKSCHKCNFIRFYIWISPSATYYITSLTCQNYQAMTCNKSVGYCKMLKVTLTK